MPLMDIHSPAIIIFLKENYEKENRIRINWISNHRERFEHAATLTREPKNYFESDVASYNMKQGLAAISRDHIVAGGNRRRVPIRDGTFIPGAKDLRHGHSIVDVGLGDPKVDPRLARPDTDKTIDPVMRPVDPKLKKIIYKSKPGRLQYLEKRNNIMPEKKYYFQECGGWEYGWRLRDSKLVCKHQYGRCFRLTKNLRSRVGLKPDPPYYRDSKESPAKCLG